MNLIKLNCPNCSGALELPDNLTVAHCLYCGNKILLDQDGVAQERRDIERYVELRQVAVDAKNHNDVIKYCNLILEIDPRNIEGWVNKEVSTFWLTTGANNRYDEALEYLNKASQLGPDDRRIADARKELTLQQANWYDYLGVESFKSAASTYNLYLDNDDWDHEKYAKLKSQDEAIEAMNKFLTASRYDPDNITILEHISDTASFYDVVAWSEGVASKIKHLKDIRAKKDAEIGLANLQADLSSAKKELATLQSQKGLFIGNKIKDAERRIRKLEEEITNLAKTLAA